MNIPLGKKLKKRMHVEIGVLQDQLIDLVYLVSENAVLHGGTAIWRCYSGNRFSEDLDFYAIRTENFAKKFESEIKKNGLTLMKFKETENLVFSKISDGNVEVRAEFNFARYKKGEIMQYERMDGTTTSIVTLSIDELIEEKVDAYLGRKMIRDVYDIYHLLNLTEKENHESLERLLKNIPKPIDEENLKAMIYSGAVPSFEQMIARIKRR